MKREFYMFLKKVIFIKLIHINLMPNFIPGVKIVFL
jgi:hypothetical protein